MPRVKKHKKGAGEEGKNKRPLLVSLEEFVRIPGKGAGAGRAGIRSDFSCVPSWAFGIESCPPLLSSEDSRYKVNSSLENS